MLFDFAFTNRIVYSGKLFRNTTKIPQLIGSMGQIYANIYSCPKIPPLQGIGVRKIELKLKDATRIFSVYNEQGWVDKNPCTKNLNKPEF